MIPVAVDRNRFRCYYSHPALERNRFENDIRGNQGDKLAAGFPESAFETAALVLAGNDFDRMPQPELCDTAYEPFRGLGVRANEEFPFRVLLGID